MSEREIACEQSSTAQQAASADKTEAPLILRGRSFSSDDLQIVSRCVREHYDKGRTRISEIVCEKLDWRQPNGWLKDRACRDVLRRLDGMGIISLPAPLVRKRSKNLQCQERAGNEGWIHLSQHDMTTPVSTWPEQITFRFAKGNDDEGLWNEVVREYHYLGQTVTVGRCIKYLIFGKERLLGAIAFSSPAWQLTPRDSLLKSLGFQAAEIHDIVVQNSRFLILPHVRVPNLASRVLSTVAHQLVRDWTAYYAVSPLVAETFVESSRYEGTCYKAANWVEIGLTKGYSKSGASHHNSREPKSILLYGLNRHMRRKLSMAATTRDSS